MATGCHFHEETQFCIVDGAEFEVTNPVEEAKAPESYSGCHFQDRNLYVYDSIWAVDE